MNLANLIYNLPKEVVYKIIYFSSKPQPKVLLLDIKNYIKTKKLGIILYSKRYEQEPHQILNWFCNDIGIFMNDTIPTMYGYVDKFYNIYFRLKMIKDKQTILTIAYKFTKGKPEREMSVLWGLLTPDERISMITMFYNEKEIKELYL